MPAPRRLLLLAPLALLLGAGSAPAPAPDDFAKQIDAWRAARLERLRSESGWLSLVGLFWLRDGENRFGSDAGNDLVLPEGMAPPVAGSFFLSAGKVRIAARPGAGVTLAGAPLAEKDDLAGDDTDKPDELHLGTLTMYVIRRAGKVGIRVKSPESPARKAFHGLDYFPANAAYRVVATFTPAPRPREIQIVNVLGQVEPMKVPGTLHFTLGGKRLALEPVLESPDATELFILFRDETAGKETYEAGRFLYAELPKDGKVVLDFNKAYNPPCAFTAFATCPLPPRQNLLPVRVPAGEKAYRGHD